MAKGPVNLDFKEGEAGQVPKGWLNPTRTTGFPAAATEQCSRPGARCAVLRSEPVASPAPFGNLMQALDATAYRNKQIRFRASVRVETAGGGRAQLWVRVDRGSRQMGFFDNMGDRRITSAEWRPYEIAGEVSEDATGIFFGMTKNVSVRYTGNDRATRLADVVMAWNIFQHFYPYFEVVRTDWPKALTTALQSAAANKDEKEFLITLRRLLRALKDGQGGVYVQGQALMAPPVVFGWVQNQLVVTQVAEAAGQPIERGDAVLSIDGKPAARSASHPGNRTLPGPLAAPDRQAANEAGQSDARRAPPGEDYRTQARHFQC